MIEPGGGLTEDRLAPSLGLRHLERACDALPTLDAPPATSAGPGWVRRDDSRPDLWLIAFCFSCAWLGDKTDYVWLFLLFGWAAALGAVYGLLWCNPRS